VKVASKPAPTAFPGSSSKSATAASRSRTVAAAPGASVNA
jgi:hypothetical protein